MALHIDYRPRGFNEVVGNDESIIVLSSMMRRDDKPHSYLFTGPSGCGKTTLARLTREALKCSDADYREMNSADFRGIDTIRELIHQMRLAPMHGPCRVWLLDECHQLSKDAQNALLKALEDTPSHAYLLLATTNPEKLLQTIRSRCSSFSVSPLSGENMQKLLEWVLKEEGVKLTERAVQAMIDVVQGAPRTALVLLDKVIDIEDEEARLRFIKAHAVDEAEIVEVCRALFNKAAWKQVAGLLTNLRTQDPEKTRRAILGYCSNILMKEDKAQAFLVIDAFEKPTYDIGWPGIVASCYEALDCIREGK